MGDNIAAAGQNQIGQVQNIKVSAKEFAAKYQEKRECYTFLAVECDVYLPPYGKSRCSVPMIYPSL